MIPSRGLRWSSRTSIGISRRRIESYSARNFSSSVQHNPFRSNTNPSTILSKTHPSFANPYLRPQFSKAIHLIRNRAGVRFASTTPSPIQPQTLPSTTSIPPASIPSASVPSTSPSEAVASATSSTEFTSSLDDVTDLTQDSLYNIPESIGYLKSLGLDYGFGPTGGMEWILEHVHIYAGTPWWVSIALTAILIRVAVVKFYVGAADNAARLVTIKHITDPVTKRMREAQQSGEVQTVLRIRNELKMIHTRAGIQMWRSFAPVMTAFTGYGTFRILRGMANLPVPGLETGGTLWFYNLAIPDPYFILPIATAGMLHWVFRIGGETGQTTLSPEMMKAFMYGMPILTIAFTWFLPAAVQVSFLVTGILSFIQARLFRSTTFRKYVGIAPLPKPTSGLSSSPYKGILKVAAPSPSSHVLSSSELHSRFEPGTGTNITAHEAAEAQASRIQKMIKGLRKPVDEIISSGKSMAAKGNQTLDGRRLKSQLEEKKRFETKRQAEMQKERWERENERRLERAAKKKGL